MCVVTCGDRLGQESVRGAGNLPPSEDFHQSSSGEQSPPQDRKDTPAKGEEGEGGIKRRREGKQTS